MNNAYCSAEIHDCGPSTLPVSTGCISLSTSPSSDCIIITPTSIKTPNSISRAGYRAVPFDRTSNVSFADCAISCAKDERCTQLEYARTNGYVDTGICNLYRDTGDLYGDDTQLSLFSDVQRPAGSSSQCITLNLPKGPISISSTLDTSGPRSTRTESDYQGVGCRKWLTDETRNTTDNIDSIQAMGRWCQSNKDVDVCDAFCSTDAYFKYCGIYIPIELLVSIGVLLILALIAIFVFIQGRTTPAS